MSVNGRDDQILAVLGDIRDSVRDLPAIRDSVKAMEMELPAIRRSIVRLEEEAVVTNVRLDALVKQTSAIGAATSEGQSRLSSRIDDLDRRVLRLERRKQAR